MTHQGDGLHREARRRFTWVLHNVVMTLFLPVRLLLVGFICAGNLADMALDRMPGCRRYNGWSGW